MRNLILALSISVCFAESAWAQARVFVAGDIFADLKRFSSSGGPSTLDGNDVGGGGSVGILVDDRWSVSLMLDQGTSTSRTIAVAIPLETSVALPCPAVSCVSRFQSDLSNRVFAASVLLGYHAGSGHRVRPGVVGGLTFVHVRRRTTTIPGPLAIGTPAGVALVVLPTEATDNVPAATVGAEAAIELTNHVSAVPQVLADAFSLNGGPSGFAIRPGFALRWMF